MQLMLAIFRDIYRVRSLSWRLFVKDVNSAYRQSLLGYFWLVFPPLAISFGMILLRDAGVLRLTDEGQNLAAYIVCGVLIWQIFSESIVAPVFAVKGASHMLTKLSFPYEALLLAKFCELLLGITVRCLILFLLAFYFDLDVSWAYLLIPPLLLVTAIFGFSIGVTFSPLAGLYQDVEKGLVIVLLSWMLLSPVLYEIPESGLLAEIMAINPVSYVLVLARELFFDASLNSVQYLFYMIPVALTCLCVSLLVYRITMPVRIERLGN